MELIDKNKVLDKIQSMAQSISKKDDAHGELASVYGGQQYVLMKIFNFVDNLEEVDLEKLGEIARHLIAVKKHIEDIRLNKEEWLILEKIGYPERFKAQKGE